MKAYTWQMSKIVDHNKNDRSWDGEKELPILTFNASYPRLLWIKLVRRFLLMAFFFYQNKPILYNKYPKIDQIEWKRTQYVSLLLHLILYYTPKTKNTKTNKQTTTTTKNKIVTWIISTRRECIYENQSSSF